MNFALIISALSIGFLGSFHCIGMCGALALSLPVQHLEGNKKNLGILLYNLGRVCTYASLGLLFGLVGSSFQLFGWQQILSIIAGLLLLIMAFLQISGSRNQTPLWLDKYWNKPIISKIAPLFNGSKLINTFTIGLLNGLLPCGLVYIAIAGALATSNSLSGALFMALFGLGTLPAMFAIGITGNKMGYNFRNLIKRSTPYVIAIMGVLLVLRGANLGIPYLSPTHEKGHVNCCSSK